MYRLGMGQDTTDAGAAAVTAGILAQGGLNETTETASLQAIQAANPLANLLGVTTSTANWIMVGGGILALVLLFSAGGRRR